MPETYHIYENLAWLNELSSDDAVATFLNCCGSTDWARRMVEKRPFALLDDLFSASRRIWFSLSPADQLEAFAAHPKIGSTKKAAGQSDEAGKWSSDEQSQVTEADKKIRDELADANRLYEQKFGFIFIVFAPGKSADEMLAICKARYRNSVETELQIAADDQQKITELRFTKLLEK